MKLSLLLLDVVMFVTAFVELYVNSYALAGGLFLIAILSGAALFFAGKYLTDSDRDRYDLRMKAIQSMTMVCAFISLYWPYDVYYNISLFACLVFHCVLRKYVKLR
jgi:hypothetical protein